MVDTGEIHYRNGFNAGKAEAADEIERLSSEVQELKIALSEANESSQLQAQQDSAAYIECELRATIEFLEAETQRLRKDVAAERELYVGACGRIEELERRIEELKKQCLEQENTAFSLALDHHITDAQIDAAVKYVNKVTPHIGWYLLNKLGIERDDVGGWKLEHRHESSAPEEQTQRCEGGEGE